MLLHIFKPMALDRAEIVSEKEPAIVRQLRGNTLVVRFASNNDHVPWDKKATTEIHYALTLTSLIFTVLLNVFSSLMF